MNPLPPVQEQTLQRLCNDLKFWTSCPSCKLRHLYPFYIMGMPIKCTRESCMTDFFAYADNAQETPSGNCVVSPKKDDQNHGRQNVALSSNTNILSSCTGEVSPSFTEAGVAFEVGGNSKGEEGRSKCMESTKERKWSRQLEQAGSASDVEEILQTQFAKSLEGKSKCTKSRKKRKWFRELEHERSSSDVEQISPTEFAQSAERKKGKQVVAADDEGLKAANGIDSRCCLKSKLDQNITVVAETDFHDFDTYKREECFAADQMWALYDETDAMPRYYAWIDKVYSPGFKVQMTWLNYSTSNDQDGNRWNENGLPIACGNFIYGETVDTEAIGIFSHRIEWATRTKKGPYQIYPRNGEIWALFKNWDVEWSSDPVNHRKYDYEYVEVLSDYKKKSGAKVEYLSKIEGFSSLFKTDNDNLMASFCIPHEELLKFSHRVPSYKMTGGEREDILKGSFELDPASLPVNMERTPNPVNVKAELEANGAKVIVSSKASAEEIPHKQKKRNKPGEINTVHRRGISKCSNWSRRLTNVKKKTRIVETSSCLLDKNKTTIVSDNKKSCDDSTFVRESTFTCHAAADGKEIGPDGMNTIFSSPAHLEPDTVFYNFDNDRSREKFNAGQVWALYCDLDTLPKYYGKIKNVELFPVFKLDIQWLESCNPPKGVIPLTDKSMPICCGTFKVTCGKDDVFNDLGYFSHQLSSVTAGNNLYNIYPRKGEVWALYKNFSPELRCSDLKNCGYYIVEVIKIIDACWIQVLVLQNVTGLKTVVQAKKEVGPDIIPWPELYRFSHQIPSFKLAEARYGNLFGCWVLDPKSVPVHLYSTN